MESVDLASCPLLKGNRFKVIPLVGLTGGASKIISASGEQYLLRRQTKWQTQLGVNCQIEGNILHYLERFHCSLCFSMPKVEWQSSDFLLLNWMQGRVVESWNDDVLVQLAIALAKLHQIPISHSLPKLDLKQRLKFLLGHISITQNQHLLSIPAIPDADYSIIAHHDLNMNNVLINNNKLSLIDWEYAAVSDIALELALFFASNQLSRKQQLFFLDSYHGCTTTHLTANECKKLGAKIEQYKPAAQYLNQLWQVVKQTNKF